MPAMTAVLPSNIPDMNYQVTSLCCARLAVIPMSQIKIFGLRSALSPVIKEISDVIQSCVVDALNYPVDKPRAPVFPARSRRVFLPAGAHGALHDYRNQ